MAPDPGPNKPPQHHPIIAREGWPLVAAFAMGSLLLSAAAWWLSPVAGWIVALVGG